MLEGDRERIALVQEFIGYCLLPDTKRHVFLMLEGEGANGKSVVLETICALLGEDNVSHVPLEAFGVRFQLTPTLGRLANIAPETDESTRVNLGAFKQFVAGDRMYFDRKGVAGIQARPTARVLIATNNRPAFLDRSEGLWRRMLLIPFRVTIPQERQDRELTTKLRAELPGIFNWALAGLQRLETNGFTRAVVSDDAVGEYRLESNPTGRFLTECCAFDVTAESAVDYTYAAYRSWCQSHGYPVLNANQFGKEVRRRYRQVERVRVTRFGARTYVYRGLALTDARYLSHMEPAAA